MFIRSIKNVWLSSMLLCGSMISASHIIDQYFCNFPALNALEQKKLDAFITGLAHCQAPVSSSASGPDSSCCMYPDAVDTLIYRFMSKFGTYSDLLEAYEGRTIDGSADDIKEIKNTLRIFSERLRQDPDFTNLFKNLVGFSCKHLGLLIDKTVLSPNYDKIKCGYGCYSTEELIVDFAGYIPKNIDVVQIAIEYTIWSHGYLKKQLDAKKHLSTDDLCYVLKELSVAFKLPQQGSDLWNEFMVAIQQGLKDLPQDLRNEIMKPIQDTVRKPELEIGMKLVAAMAKMRREIIATKGADQGKLIGYGKLIDQVITQIHKAVKNNSRAENQSTKAIIMD